MNMVLRRGSFWLWLLLIGFKASTVLAATPDTADFWGQSEWSSANGPIADVSWLKTAPDAYAPARVYPPSAPVLSSATSLPLPPAETSAITCGSTLICIKGLQYARRRLRRWFSRES